MGAKTQVYTISSEQLTFKSNETDTEQELTADEQKSIILKTQSFSENFTDEQFSDVYTLKNDITDVLESKSSQSRQSQLEEMKAKYGNDLQIYNAADSVTKEMIQKTSYEKTSISNNLKVKRGEPVYKLITSDKWTIVISLDDETAKELAETKSIKVRFGKDNDTVRASFSIKNTSKD